jgi:hypothetical protein
MLYFLGVQIGFKPPLVALRHDTHHADLLAQCTNGMRDVNPFPRWKHARRNIQKRAARGKSFNRIGKIDRWIGQRAENQEEFLLSGCKKKKLHRLCQENDKHQSGQNLQHEQHPRNQFEMLHGSARVSSNEDRKYNGSLKKRYENKHSSKRAGAR